MENSAQENQKKLYRVHDEMAMEDLLETNDLREAREVAYDHQCILFDNINNKVIHDYSCY